MDYQPDEDRDYQKGEEQIDVNFQLDEEEEGDEDADVEKAGEDEEGEEDKIEIE